MLIGMDNNVCLLHPKIFQWIVQTWVCPEFVLIASFHNVKLSNFYSRFPCTLVTWSNMLTSQQSFTFPAVSLILKFLSIMPQRKSLIFNSDFILHEEALVFTLSHLSQQHPVSIPLHPNLLKRKPHAICA